MRWKFWLRYRVFLYLLLGLIAVDGLLHAASEALSLYDPNDYLERLAGCRRRQPDAVLIGGSVVSEGLDPAALAGLRWHGQRLTRPFNLGMPGGTVSEVWHAVEHGLPAPPRLMIYGITASDLNDGRQEPYGPATLMDGGDLARWVRSRPESAEWVCRHFVRGRCARLWRLYHYRNALRGWASDRLEQLVPGLCPEEADQARRNRAYTLALRQPDGFAPQPASRYQRLSWYRAAGRVQPIYWALKNYRLGGGHLLYLHHLLDWARTRDVAVILVDMPVSPDLEERLHRAEFAAYRAVLAEVARDRRLPLLRATRQAVGLGDTDFSDEIHLNGTGTAKMSTWLRHALAERETMP